MRLSFLAPYGVCKMTPFWKPISARYVVYWQPHILNPMASLARIPSSTLRSEWYIPQPIP